MSDIDYSKPVGCPSGAIPVFTPLPVPEPCVIDDLGDVVTVTQSLSRRTAEAFGLLRSSQCMDVFASVDATYGDDDEIKATSTTMLGATAYNINRIARASAKLRRKGER